MILHMIWSKENPIPGQFGYKRMHTKLVKGINHIVLCVEILSANLCNRFAGDWGVRANLREASIEY